MRFDGIGVSEALCASEFQISNFRSQKILGDLCGLCGEDLFVRRQGCLRRENFLIFAND